jgi:hypothetical protein
MSLRVADFAALRSNCLTVFSHFGNPEPVNRHCLKAEVTTKGSAA